MTKNTVTTIDFGTSKITTLVAENSSTQRCDIIAAGFASYDGYMDGTWNNPMGVDEAIRASIEEAQSQAGIKIREVNIGIPGAFIKVCAAKASVTLSGTDPRVTPADVKAAFDQAAEKLKEHNGVVVHSSPAWFSVDNSKKTLEPVGMKGHELNAFISFLVADPYFIDDLTARMADMNLTIAGFFSTSAGEAMLFLNEQERDRTSVLIDMGYLNTEIIGVEGDAIIYHKVLNAGGGDITVALVDGLDISLETAEDIKRRFVYGIDSADEKFEVTLNEKTATFTREQVKPLICKAVDDIAAEIKEAIDNDFGSLGNWSNVFMTGGGLSINRGGKEYLGGKLGRTVQDTPRRTTKMNNHRFSSALGLMDLVIDSIEQRNRPANASGGRLKRFFKSLVGG